MRAGRGGVGSGEVRGLSVLRLGMCDAMHCVEGVMECSKVCVALYGFVDLM